MVRSFLLREGKGSTGMTSGKKLLYSAVMLSVLSVIALEGLVVIKVC